MFPHPWNANPLTTVAPKYKMTSLAAPGAIVFVVNAISPFNDAFIVLVAFMRANNMFRVLGAHVYEPNCANALDA